MSPRKRRRRGDGADAAPDDDAEGAKVWLEVMRLLGKSGVANVLRDARRDDAARKEQSAAVRQLKEVRPEQPRKAAWDDAEDCSSDTDTDGAIEAAMNEDEARGRAEAAAKEAAAAARARRLAKPRINRNNAKSLPMTEENIRLFGIEFCPKRGKSYRTLNAKGERLRQRSQVCAFDPERAIGPGCAKTTQFGTDFCAEHRPHG